MILRSLRRRFAFVAGGAVIVALVAAGFALNFIYDGNIRARAIGEVGDELRSLAANVAIGEDGRVVMNVQLPDPRFQTPYGGYYWQVGRGRMVDLRSQSLMGFTIDWPPTAPTGNDLAIYERPAPEGRRMLVLERRVVLVRGGVTNTLRIAVGLDQAELDEARTAFMQFAILSLASLGVALIMALWFATRVSLAPLDSLRQELTAVHDGRRKAVEGAFPDEVKPLVDDLNVLLDARNADLVAARARAGDLAHGLKTPLAVLASIARQLRESGQNEIADEVDGEIARMSRHVSRELMRARAGVRAFRRMDATPIRPVVETLVKAMTLMPSPKPVQISNEVGADVTAAMDEGDLTEVLGNVVDNARKWATSRVRLKAEVLADGGVRIIVEDDGPGLPDSETAYEIERGKRLDEQVEGTGFGLAIVKDLTEAYGGELALGKSQLGGLKVEIVLP